MAKAKAAAGGRQLTVVGGATLIQSLLRRGAVDELQVDIMPVLLREGLRLFEHLGDKENALERVGVHALAHGRTALRFAVKGLTHARS
jgi:dihydrofolate reductase